MNRNGLKRLNTPAYLLNAPFSLSTDQPNNATMRKLTPEQRRVDKDRALRQWLQLYHFLAAKGLVYLLPSRDGLQDQTFVANLGIVLPHLQEDVAVVSNFRSEPRRGETEAGYEFFKSMGFTTVIAPEYFEGEADLKYLRDNLYFGAHGMRTSMAALEWFRQSYDMEIIPIKLYDEHLYHLDCVVFPLSAERVILCTEVCSREIIRAIERVADIIDIEYDLANRGLTNSMRCGNHILCDSHIDDLKESDALYQIERNKIAKLNQICAQYGFEPVIFNLSEFYKSGAMLSCMIMSLTYT